MSKKDLIKVWTELEKTAKRQEDFYEVIDEMLLNNAANKTGTKETIAKLLSLIMDRKYSIGESSQRYFISYASTAFRESEYSYNNPDVIGLIPAVFLVHHSVELFIKFVKLDFHTWFGTKDTFVENFLPANIRDLKLNKHSVINVLDDSDCVCWFSYIENGERLRLNIKRKYNLICELLGEDDIAVNMRYPMANGYRINDYKRLTKKDIQEISLELMDLVGLCIIADFSWAKNVDKREKLINDIHT